MITQFEKYGHIGLVKGIYHKIRERFTITPYMRNLAYSRGMDVYVPKLNKLRFGTACILSLILIILPLVTLLAVPTMLWGIK